MPIVVGQPTVVVGQPVVMASPGHHHHHKHHKHHLMKKASKGFGHLLSGAAGALAEGDVSFRFGSGD